MSGWLVQIGDVEATGCFVWVPLLVLAALLASALLEAVRCLA
jgi:hypothetical protein